MYEFKSDFMKLLVRRGYLKQCTDDINIDEMLINPDSKKLFYIGFDCTAPSLHVGSLMQIMLLRHGQRFGITPIVMLGGGTTKIGDPSGKDKTREMITDDTIEYNKKSITEVIRKFISFDGPNAAIMVDNSEWWDDMRYIDFLREIGSVFSVNRMIKLDSVSARLERQQEMSFIEFNYVLLQSYDFYQLFKRYGCRIQAGGSDQWGNIVNGIDLVRRKTGAHCYGLTTPLLTSASGKKMGKTENGAIWLSNDMCSAYEYWQYFRNIDDSDVRKMFYLFTEMGSEDIESLLVDESKINDAKKVLATEVTTICHGKELANSAVDIAANLFSNKSDYDKECDIFIDNVDSNHISLKELVLFSGMLNTSGEIKRTVAGGGLYINNDKIDNIDHLLNKSEFPIKLSIGKKKHIVIGWK